MRTDVAVPGSRLFSHVSAGLVARRKLRGGRDTRQSSSPPGVGNKLGLSTCQPFEYEEDADRRELGPTVLRPVEPRPKTSDKFTDY
jgi:hypothetical protein